MGDHKRHQESNLSFAPQVHKALYDAVHEYPSAQAENLFLFAQKG